MADEYPIISSKINLYKSSTAGTTNLNALHIYTSWSSNTLTWSNSPNCDTSYAVYNGLWSGSWYVIDITELTERWDCGMYSNYGVKLYDDNETNTAVWSTFYSSDYGTITDTPKLVISLSTTSTYFVLGPHYYTNTFQVSNELSTFSPQLSEAVAAWNASGADCNISINSTSPNRVYIDDDISFLGLTYAQGDPYYSFRIAINSARINAIAEWSKCATGVMVHELGHALGLVDLPAQEYAIMGYAHDWNTVYKPTISDITGVNSNW